MHSSRNSLSSRLQCKKIIHSLQSVCMTAFLVSGIAALAPHSQAQKAVQDPVRTSPGVVPGEVLVGIRADQDDAQEADRLGAVGAISAGRQANLHAYRLRLQPGVSISTAIARLQQRGEVLYAEPNHVYRVSATPNNTYYSNQYALRKIQADLAWEAWNPTGQVIVAIVDTGIDNTHPALTNKIYRDGSGIVGYNAFTGLRDNASDDFGHGTHCAGIAAAQINNNTGVAGIAGWNGVANQSDANYTKLMPVKVLDSSGSGSDATVASGITWAADHGAKVISLSLGGSDSSNTLNNAVQYAWNKGCVIVAAAGNNGASSFSYPAAYANVISVGATDNNDQLASFSNYGSWVMVAAPGSNIYSTVPTYAANGGYGINYNYLSGTSMATPHVAGEAALLLAQNPALTNSQVRSLIVNNVDPYTPYSAGRNIAANAGRINVYRALLAAGGTAKVPNAPINLVAASANTQVSLAWDLSVGATTYNVKRSVTSGGPYTTVASGVTTTTYTDTGLTNGVTFYYVVSGVNSIGESANSAQVSATPSTQTFVYRLNAGGGAVSLFSADDYSVGGSTTSTNLTMDTTGVTNAAPMAVYQSLRYGNFNYTMPGLVPAVTYTVRLHFAETYFTSAGSRIFNVAINGTTVLSNFDIVGAVGAYKAVVKEFTAIADAGGKINIAFTTVVNNAQVNGVEIISGSGGGTGIPSAPTGLTAAAGNGQVTLAWSAVTGATSYKVYRSTTSGSGYTLIGSPAANSGLDTSVTNGTTYYYVVTAVNTSGESANSNQVAATPSASTAVYQINAGGGASGSFSADTFSTGGSGYTVAQAITTGVANAAPMAVYQSLRYGNFSYVMPSLTPGTTYTVRLHFAETYHTAAGKRVFNVAINGANVLSSFDIVAAAGAANKAVVKEFTAVADANGKITISFTTVVDAAVVNGIEILSGTGGGGGSIPSAPTGLTATAAGAQVSLGWNAVTGATSYNVYRSTSNGSGYTLIGNPGGNSGLDTGLTNGTTYYYVVTAVNTSGESANSSQVSATPSASTAAYQINAGGGASGSFSADSYFNGGSGYAVSSTIDTSAANAAPAGVYQSLRYGNFSYVMPSLTPGTTYTVRLHFAETYHTAAGKRVFNVGINGANVLSSFDIVAAAGAANKAVVKQFTAVADANGKITLSFTTVVDAAVVNGIEILP
jgi:subtilisin family serine protease